MSKGVPGENLGEFEHTPGEPDPGGQTVVGVGQSEGNPVPPEADIRNQNFVGNLIGDEVEAPGEPSKN